jgi:hypothetical protein
MKFSEGNIKPHYSSYKLMRDFRITNLFTFHFQKYDPVERNRIIVTFVSKFTSVLVYIRR